MDTVDIAVVGSGRMGSFHARSLASGSRELAWPR